MRACFKPNNFKPNNRGAFFDLDLTLTEKDCFRLFLKTMYVNRVSGMVYLPYLICLWVLRKIRIISLRTFKERSLICLKGLSHGKVKATGDLFFEHRIKPWLRQKAIEKIQWHRRQGDQIFIITGSPDIYVHSVCDFLGCEAYACTRLEYADGKYTGRIKGKDCMGQEKKNLILELADWHGIDLTDSFAYSDHESDMPFFETLGQKVAVSPSPILEKTALAKHWEIVRW